MMKGIPHEDRDKAWHERHILRMKQRARQRLLNMQHISPTNSEPIHTPTAQAISFWAKIKQFFYNLFH